MQIRTGLSVWSLNDTNPEMRLSRHDMIPFNLHRRIPFIRRPFYQRDLARGELARVQHTLTEREGELASAAGRIAEQQQRLADTEGKLADAERRLAEMVAAKPLLIAQSEGRLVEFDYAYSPTRRPWPDAAGPSQIRQLLHDGIDRYMDRLTSFLAFAADFARIPIAADPADTIPFWDNGWLPSLDAMSIYGLLATLNPATYFEIGSGNSTKFARRAITDHGLRTRVVSVDPCPRASIDALCDEVIRLRCEAVPNERYRAIPADSVVFVDSSHRSFQDSDVTVFFAEILPVLPAGIIWGLHDIFLPEDYPAKWTDRYYNEQYLLMAYLLGRQTVDQVLLPNAFVAGTNAFDGVRRQLLPAPLQPSIEMLTSCFWLRRERAWTAEDLSGDI